MDPGYMCGGLMCALHLGVAFALAQVLEKLVHKCIYCGTMMQFFN